MLTLAIICLALSLNLSLNLLIKILFYLSSYHRDRIKVFELSWSMSLLPPICVALTVLFFILYFKSHH